MIMEIVALTEKVFGDMASQSSSLPWPINDIMAYFNQLAMMMGGFDIVALLFLAGLIIGILASMAYVALKII
jgi:dihydrofolate reductase